MKHIKWIVPLLFSASFLVACSDKEETKQSLPKEEVKSVQEVKKEPKAKEAKATKEEKKTIIDSKENNQKNVSEVTPKKEHSPEKIKTVQPFTKEEQGKEYLRLTNYFLTMRFEQTETTDEWNAFFESAKNNTIGFTERQKEKIKDVSIRHETLLQQQLKELKQYKIDPRVPENMEKAMDSIRLDFIQELEYEIAYVRQVQRLDNVTPQAIGVEMKEIDTKLIEVEERVEIKNQKMEEYFEIDAGEAYALEFVKGQLQ